MSLLLLYCTCWCYLFTNIGNLWLSALCLKLLPKGEELFYDTFVVEELALANPISIVELVPNIHEDAIMVNSYVKEASFLNV